MQPFDDGDLVKIAGSVGRVLRMTFAYTVIEEPCGITIHVPNAAVANSAIFNLSKKGEVHSSR